MLNAGCEVEVEVVVEVVVGASGAVDSENLSTVIATGCRFARDATCPVTAMNGLLALVNKVWAICGGGLHLLPLKSAWRPTSSANLRPILMTVA